MAATKATRKFKRVIKDSEDEGDGVEPEVEESEAEAESSDEDGPAGGAPAAAIAPHANNPRAIHNGQLLRSTIGFGTTCRGVAVHNQQQHFGTLPSHRASQSPALKPSGEFVDMDGNVVIVAELLPGTRKRLEASEDVIHPDAQVEGGFRSMFSCAAPCATAPANLCSPCATMAPAAAVTVIASAGDAASDAASDLKRRN